MTQSEVDSLRIGSHFINTWFDGHFLIIEINNYSFKALSSRGFNQSAIIRDFHFNDLLHNLYKLGTP